MATARDRNGYTPCETMDTSTAKLKDTTVISEDGCKPDCQYRHLRELSSESACEQCEYEKQLDNNGYAHFDISTYRPSYYRYRPDKDKNCPSAWKVAVFVLLVTALFIGGLILGYFIRHKGDDKNSTVSNSECSDTYNGAITGPPLDYQRLELLHENLMYSITGDKIAKFFKNYTDTQVFTGSQSDEELIAIVETYFSQFGLRETGHEQSEGADVYHVRLCFPDNGHENKIEVLDANENVLAQHTPEFFRRKDGRMVREVNTDDQVMQPFVSYSAKAEVKGKLIYLNYGRYEDFKDALSKGKNPEGRIAVVRIGGGIAVENKIKECESHGISEVILYADPADTEHHHLSVCDLNVPYATVNDGGAGDPVTPGFPAYGDFHSRPVLDSELTTVPVQTVSCQFASELIGNMTGYIAPVSWRGGITGIMYTIEDDSNRDWSLRLTVNNEMTTQPIYNVVGTLTGEEDPDHYVIIGATRTSFDVSDRGSVVGTALLLALAEQINFLVEREAWRPNRTIKLISWASAEFGDVGMIEYLEEHEDVLRDRIVAYINLDQPVLGTYMPCIQADPVLSDIIYNVAKRVPSPDDLQAMLYDTWVERTNTRTGRQPVIHSSYRSTFQNPLTMKLGVPTTHWQYVGKNLKTANSSLLETESHKIWSHHAAVGRLSGLMALSLADASVLHYNTVLATQSLQREVEKLSRDDHQFRNISKGILNKELENLLSVSNAMEHYITHQLDFGIHSHKRIINERLLQFQTLISKAQGQLQSLRYNVSHLKGEHNERNFSLLLKYIRSAIFSLRLEL